MLIWHLDRFLFDKLKSLGWLYLFSSVWWFLLLIGVGCVSSTFCVFFLSFKEFCFFENVLVIVFIDLVLFSLPLMRRVFQYKMIRLLICCWAVCYNTIFQSLSKLLLLIAPNVSTIMSRCWVIFVDICWHFKSK